VDPDLVSRIHVDADPDPAIYVIDLQDANKKQIFVKVFLFYYFLKVHLLVHHLLKTKSQTEVAKQ
jgi:hypothetical protein